MHAIADHVVDHYLDVTDLVETDIDAMEENVFSPSSETDIEHIYLLKREVVELRRAVGPLTLALQRLGSDHNDLISKEVRRYMRDVSTTTPRRPTGSPATTRCSARWCRPRVGKVVDAAEHRHAQDLGVGGDRRRARPRWQASTG